MSKPTSNEKSVKTKTSKGAWLEWSEKEYNVYHKQYVCGNLDPQDYTLYFEFGGCNGFDLTKNKVDDLKGVCLWTEKKKGKIVIHAKNKFVINILMYGLEEMSGSSDYILDCVSAVIFEKSGPSREELYEVIPFGNFQEMVARDNVWEELYFTIGNSLIKAGTFKHEEEVECDLY